MKPAYQDAAVTIYQGHALEALAGMPDASVHCVVTSPPYYGLRDYGLPPVVWGGDPACAHEWGDAMPPPLRGPGNTPESALRTSGLTNPAGHLAEVKGIPKSGGAWCLRCSAWRGELGLEPTPGLYVEHLVAIFREVRRVLRRDGTLWLVLGDSYCNFGKWGGESGGKNETSSAGGYSRDLHAGHRGRRQVGDTKNPNANIAEWGPNRAPLDGLKSKDLVGIPWMAAFALRADGWWLRRDVIWAKGVSFCPDYSGTAMPESVTDRPSSSHEYVFLLTKAASYFYDSDAVRESWADDRLGEAGGTAQHYESGRPDGITRRPIAAPNRPGRNLRSVWTINPEPYPEAHFAAFPSALVKPIVMLGTSERGCCAACGAPWERVVRREGDVPMSARRVHLATMATDGTRLTQVGGTARSTLGAGEGGDVPGRSSVTVGWRPTCEEYEGKHADADPQAPGRRVLANVKAARAAGAPHDAPFPGKRTVGWRAECGHAGSVVPCVVLDPFAGSGRTLLVAKELGRRAIGVEAKAEYVALEVAGLRQGVLPLAP
jgi:DNA modification methylase